MPNDVSSRRAAAAERGLLLWLGLLYLVFVVYGSLVPLDYQPLPLDQAVARFWEIPFLDLGIGSRADWVANLLLFIPLTFLWTGALAHGRSDLAALLLTALLWGLGTALSLGIEFTQLFFPQRTVSQNDIFAETLGGVIGGIIWWAFGRQVLAWYGGWRRESHAGALPERLAWAYFVVLVGYNVLPLDLTLSLVEIYHKWTEGKVFLIPFMSLPGDPVQAVFELAMDTVIWVPLAWAWHARPGRSTAQVVRMSMLAVLALEFMQLFVYSRVSDVTDLLTGAVGVWLGALLGQRQFGRGRRRSSEGRGAPAALRFFAALAWLPVLMGVFWYPFDFNVEAGLVQEKMTFLQKVPFETYYYGTEFRAITEVFHKTLFFAPLGGLLAWWAAGLSRDWRTLAATVAGLVVLAAAFGVELGQMLLPGKYPDTTDILLESLGGLLGYTLARRMFKAGGTVRQPRERAATREPQVEIAVEVQPSPRPRARPGNWKIDLGVGVAVLAVALGVAGQLPQTPYNIRELLNDSGGPVLSALLLSLFLFWLAGVPVWLADQLANNRAVRPWYPLACVAHALFAALWLIAIAPRESLDDIVGSPILGWPWPLETWVRYTFLFVGMSILLSGGAWLARAVALRRWDGAMVWGLSAMLLLACSHYVVVVLAATDNLVELMRGGGGVLASMVLFVWALLLTASAAFLGHSLNVQSRSRLAAVLLVLLVLPLSYGLLLLGLEGRIDKYGQTFSALQFLLSTDREHLASDGELLLRYGLAFVVALLGLLWVQRPFLRLSGGRPATRRPH